MSKPKEKQRTIAVWDDGSVDINTPKCKGTLTPEEVARLVEYVRRLDEMASPL